MESQKLGKIAVHSDKDLLDEYEDIEEDDGKEYYVGNEKNLSQMAGSVSPQKLEPLD